MAVYAILIGTRADGTKCAVSKPMPLSAAKPALAAIDGKELASVEIFELRQASKRRKFATESAAFTPAASKAPAASKSKKQPKGKI